MFRWLLPVLFSLLLTTSLVADDDDATDDRSEKKGRPTTLKAAILLEIDKNDEFLAMLLEKLATGTDDFGAQLGASIGQKLKDPSILTNACAFLANLLKTPFLKPLLKAQLKTFVEENFEIVLGVLKINPKTADLTYQAAGGLQALLGLSGQATTLESCPLDPDDPFLAGGDVVPTVMDKPAGPTSQQLKRLSLAVQTFFKTFPVQDPTVLYGDNAWELEAAANEKLVALEDEDNPYLGKGCDLMQGAIVVHVHPLTGVVRILVQPTEPKCKTLAPVYLDALPGKAENFQPDPRAIVENKSLMKTYQAQASKKIKDKKLLFTGKYFAFNDFVEQKREIWIQDKASGAVTLLHREKEIDPETW
ncbi:MAG: hypothetical protein A2284_12125 [Deltaproteobacteria bacterium RIFOXYA12_FULL_61_11]|nr:MAG: hypothetical protein A2284_12125 [Deltaproteobacteria bacterium RIFOXYA12_FULL_61_11]